MVFFINLAYSTLNSILKTFVVILFNVDTGFFFLIQSGSSMNEPPRVGLYLS